MREGQMEREMTWREGRGKRRMEGKKYSSSEYNFVFVSKSRA